MDFVDEQNRPGLESSVTGFRLGHYRLDLFDPGKDGAVRNEPRFSLLSDYARKSGLASSRRSPEDDRTELIPFDHLSQHLSLAYQVRLACDFVKPPGAHALRQRRILPRGRRLNIGK